MRPLFVDNLLVDLKPLETLQTIVLNLISLSYKFQFCCHLLEKVSYQSFKLYLPKISKIELLMSGHKYEMFHY